MMSPDAIEPIVTKEGNTLDCRQWQGSSCR
ncbi:MAG: hypothetical protein ACLR17_22740 [Enterobacteriaceae bacterium]